MLYCALVKLFKKEIYQVPDCHGADVNICVEQQVLYVSNMHFSPTQWKTQLLKKWQQYINGPQTQPCVLTSTSGQEK